jgi:hypothetical protein
MNHARARPSIAVIIPAANCAATIGETLQSVLHQSTPACEIVITDDGSTDRTAAIVRAFMQSSPAIRLLRQARGGPAMARNVAIEATSATYIAPIDADDVWHPDFLALCLAALEAEPKAGLAYAWHHIIDPQGRTTRGPLQYTVSGGALGPMLLTNFIGNGSSAIFRRTALEAAGGFCPPLRDWPGAEDYLLQLRVAAISEIVCVQRDLVGYRRSPHSLSTDHGAVLRARLAAVQCALREYGPAPIDLERWVRGDAYRTYAFQVLQEHKWSTVAAMMWAACAADPLALGCDLLLRLRNLALRRAGCRAYPTRRPDSLLLRRLALLAQVMPGAMNVAPAISGCAYIPP